MAASVERAASATPLAALPISHVYHVTTVGRLLLPMCNESEDSEIQNANDRCHASDVHKPYLTMYASEVFHSE